MFRPGGEALTIRRYACDDIAVSDIRPMTLSSTHLLLLRTFCSFSFCITVLDIPGFHNGTAFGGEQ
jgi:hypothetical protein